MYFLKDICCLCLNSKRSNLKHIDELAKNGISYLRKLTTIIPQVSLKDMKKHRFVCAQCCQQIDQMYKFQEKCLKNQNKFVEYVSQLSFLDEERCQLSVCLTDCRNTKQLSGTKDESTEAIECQKENINGYIECHDLKFDLDSISCDEHLHIFMKQEFEAENDLKSDQRMHCGKTSVKCMHDSKSFSRSKYLGAHEQINTNEKPYKCMHCCKRFTQPTHLKSHERTHSGKKSFKCTHCSKTFTTANNLNDHKQTHAIKRLYKCMNCSKSFSKLGTLMVHELIHRAERPFKCVQCSKTFTIAHHLKKHACTHTGGRPHVCRHCSKTFTTSDYLKRHERSHTGVLLCANALF